MAKNQLSEQDELTALRNRVAELEKDKEFQADSSDRYLKEIQDLKKASSASLNNVSIKSIQGDKHISLWHVSGHNIGKRIGPVHPAAAEEIFINFSKIGVKVSMNRPTQEFIDSYKKTKEYKDFESAEIKRRSVKNRSKKESEIERLTQAIAKSQGISVKEVNQIKQQHEVGV